MNTRANHKLYSHTHPSFKTYHHIDRAGNIVTRPADNVPMLHWPNGRWCIEANLYIFDLYSHRNLSRHNRGGTLLIYSTYLSHLLRYCFRNSISFKDFTDDDFCDFIDTLKKEKDENNDDVRGDNQIIKIGRRCLDFLDFVGRYHWIENFVGIGGQIIAEKLVSVTKIIGKSGRPRKIEYWHHRCLPQQSPLKKRLPVSSGDITRLHAVVHQVSSSTFLKKRRYVMLTLLEVIGLRRSELVSLTVESVRNATHMDSPALMLQTVKGGPPRHVPIKQHVLVQLLEYIEKNRARVMRRTCGDKFDTGYLLVNEDTGAGLVPNTITQEVHFLSAAAKLPRLIGPHQFRHLFITRAFKALIEQYLLKDANDLRNFLLDGYRLKLEVAEWSGHRRIESLDPYIHLAFEGSSEYKLAFDRVALGHLVDASVRTIKEFQKEIVATTHSKEYIDSLLERLTSIHDDILKLCKAPMEADAESESS